MLAVAFLALLTACSHKLTAPKLVATLPVPETPAEVANAFQSCWRNQDPNEYRQLFTEDYRFIFANSDSAGSFYRTTPWTRSDEVAFGDHLFRDGTPTQPAANSITLDYTQDPDIQADPRPGMNSTWHKMITLQTLLRVNLSDGTQEVRGPIDLYVTRGDSARIPTDLAAAGAKPDSARWWIDLWADRTDQSSLATAASRLVGASRTLPSHGGTWGYLKSLYR